MERENEGLIGMTIGGYLVKEIVGKGTFGTVVRAIPQEGAELSRDVDEVAIKINRSDSEYREVALMEVETMEFIKENPKMIGACTLDLLDLFDHDGCICLVFELYGLSLFDFMKMNKFRGFRVKHVVDIAYQLLYTVACLHRIGVIHTDIKPENILFCEKRILPTYNSRGEVRSYKLPSSTSIKVIDYGTAHTPKDSRKTRIVSTRPYRAPEVIPGKGDWSYPCDVWSIGCTLFELMTGASLFPVENSQEHLMMIQELVGDVPGYTSAPRDCEHITRRIKRRQTFIEETLDYITSPTGDTTTGKIKLSLIDLVSQLLTVDPRSRVSASQALQHSVFNDLKAKIEEYSKV